jgi:ABC-type dipeptide/oligopeptide/nickel transport system permease component
VLQTAATLLGASALVWAIVPLAPGDPAEETLRARGAANPPPAAIEAVRGELGLDRPVPLQYVHWLGRAVQGDLSRSYRTNVPVATELVDRLPATLRLAGAALLICMALAIPSGLIAAAFAGRWPDSLLRGAAVVGSGLPGFVVGLVLIELVVIRGGHGQALTDGTLAQVWLPAISLAVGFFGVLARFLRAALLDALDQPFAIVACARGVSRRRLLLRHALPNAAVPFLQVTGFFVGHLLGGAIIVELVFNWPGLGSYVVGAVEARDLPAVQGAVLVFTLFFVLSALLADHAARAIDPRVA